MSQHAETARRIAEILERELGAVVTVTDESWKHAGHAGAREGGGHFSALIRAKVFAGKGLLERQRMVYAALGAMMQKEIHALSMKCEVLE